MDADLPRSEPFRWNAQAWFGAQVGATVWMLVAAACLLPAQATMAVVTFVVFLVPTVLGIVLWRRRRTLRPYPCIQLLIGVTGACALVLFVLWRRLPVEGLEQAFGEQARYLHYGWLLVFPALMLMFHLQRRAALRRGGE